MTPFDIVVNPVGSLFAKRLQGALQALVKNKVYRRNTPKTLAARPPLISRRGNVLRQGRSQQTRPFFQVTPRVLDKIEQLRRFVAAGISCPRFATNEPDARGIQCKTLFARTLINSTNGRGIIEFAADSMEYPRAPLYTEYIPKKAEYRFHVFGDKVIDIQQKKKRGDWHEDNRNTRIRNMANGYVYCRDGINPPDGAADLAIRAVKACGYLYGAVDVIYNEKRNASYVLEVNSRPGLMGATLESYANAIADKFFLERK